MKPQRARVIWISVALMGMVGLTAVQVGATSLNPYTYNVDGQLSIVGNDVCAPSPCTETVSFSFLFQWAQAFADAPTDLPILYVGVVVPGSSTVISSGPLSPFTMFEGNLGDYYYLPMGNTGDEIDLGLLPWSVTPWVAPSFGGPSLYACRTTSCITDFVPPDQNTGASAYYYPNIQGAAFQVTVTAVPEAGTLGLLSFGLVGLALWQWKQRGRALA